MRYRVRNVIYRLAFKAAPYANKSILKYVKRAFAPVLRTRQYKQRLRYESGAYPGGINLLGYLRAQMGLGQGARLYARAIMESGIPYVLLNTTVGNPSKHNDNELKGLFSSSFKYNTNILHVNAEQMSLLYSSYSESAWNRRYNIGVWLWELEYFPDEWHKSFQYLDEIWTPSTFTSRSVLQASPLPVTTIPYGIEARVDTACTRETFGLPEDAFLFLCMYDVNSMTNRKNPLGAINAFKEAFGKGNSEAGLVIKVNNAKPGDIEVIRQLTKGCKNVYIIPSVLEKSQVNALIQSCDVLVSLHRSEGFGLVIAEAMFLGIPVIATNWSANTDFMNTKNSCPVDYKLIDVGQNYYLSRPGQRWADPDIMHAAQYMIDLFTDCAYRTQIALEGQKTIQSNFSIMKSSEKIKKRLNEIGLVPDV